MELELCQSVGLNAGALHALALNSQAAGSLFHYMNHCKTAQGERLLGLWLRTPLRSAAEIRRRQAMVELFVDDGALRAKLRDSYLARMPDFERLAKRMQRSAAGLADLYRLYEAIEPMPHLLAALESACGDSELVEPLRKLCSDDDKSKMSQFRKFVDQVLDFDHLKETQGYRCVFV